MLIGIVESYFEIQWETANFDPPVSITQEVRLKICTDSLLIPHS